MEKELNINKRIKEVVRRINGNSKDKFISCNDWCANVILNAVKEAERALDKENELTTAVTINEEDCQDECVLSFRCERSLRFRLKRAAIISGKTLNKFCIDLLIFGLKKKKLYEQAPAHDENSSV